MAISLRIKEAAGYPREPLCFLPASTVITTASFLITRAMREREMRRRER
jgi:hypothetical protein